MKTGRLTKIGDSYGIIVPAPVRRELRWWPGDDIQIDMQDGALVLRNTTQHDVQPINVRRDYGDGSIR